MKLIERKDYLKTLINVKNTPDIKVITGSEAFREIKITSFIYGMVKNKNRILILYILICKKQK